VPYLRALEMRTTFIIRRYTNFVLILLYFIIYVQLFVVGLISVENSEQAKQWSDTREAATHLSIQIVTYDPPRRTHMFSR